MVLSLRETVDQHRRANELQEALGLKNKSQTIAAAISHVHALVCPENENDVLGRDSWDLAKAMFMKAALLRASKLSHEEKSDLARNLADMLYTELRYGVESAGRGPFDMRWLNVWYATLVHQYRFNATPEPKAWETHDIMSLLILSAPQKGKRVAIICPDLPAMGYLFQRIVNTEVLNEIYMDLFVRNLEKRTSVVRCGLTHLGVIADSISDEDFSKECRSSYEWWSDHGLAIIVDKVQREKAEACHAETVERVRVFLARHDAVEVVRDPLRLSEIINVLPQAFPCG